jgi:hypothetical protein
MVNRFLVLGCVVVLGMTAPARAWCEATCLEAHGDVTKPHCPTHEPADSGTSLSATVIDDCPVVESARPTVTARLDAHGATIAAIAPAPEARVQSRATSFVRPHGITTVFERGTPLRI